MRVKVQQIHLYRAEGRADECYGTTAASFPEANAILFRWSQTAPTSGYDKCDFRVLYEDGEVYEGRYDLQRNMAGEGPLEDHIQRYLGFVAGIWRPEWMTPEQYARVMADQDAYHGPAFRAESRAFLTRYEVGALAPELAEVA